MRHYQHYNIWHVSSGQHMSQIMACVFCQGQTFTLPDTQVAVHVASSHVPTA